MEICYSYCPSFHPGWMIGIRLNAEVIPGTVSWRVGSGRVATKTLKQDAHLGLADFTKERIASLREREQEFRQEDCERLMAAALKVSFVPAPYPWGTLDGARTALLIDNWQVKLAAEWNGHPDE